MRVCDKERVNVLSGLVIMSGKVRRDKQNF